MHSVLKYAASSVVSFANKTYKVTTSMQHGVSSVLSWPRIKINHYIIHRRVKYKVIVDYVPPQLICARCNQVPSVPKTTGCGKTVCRRCVGYRNQCPVCTNSNCVASRNLGYAQQINKLGTTCPTPQCDWRGKVEDVTKHLQQCADATVECQQCGDKVLRKLQFKHGDCCPLQIKNCLYCRKEGYAKDIIKHEETECPLRKVECPNRCGDLDIFHDQLETHRRQHCPLRPVLCKACKRVYSAEDLEGHPCTTSKVKCPNGCGDPHIFHDQLAIHLQEHCPLRLVLCRKCKGACISKDLKQHLCVHGTDKTSSSADQPLPSNNLPTPATTTTGLVKLQTTIPYTEYATKDYTKSRAEALQRLVVSCITLCLLSTVAYLRHQRVTDVEFEHDMEIPSVLLWSIFTSTLVFLTILGGFSCYKDLFKAINAKECITIALAISFIHLIRFYPNYCLQIILGSLCGSAVKVFLFQKYVTTFPGQFTNTIWVMTHFVTIILAPVVIIYYSSISNLRVAIMQLIYVIYIMVLREKQRLEIIWNNMTQENRTMGIYLVNGIVLFSMILYSVTAISYEVFSTSCSSLKIVMVAILPVAYFYIMALEQVQDTMLEFGGKLYKSSVYSFWGRLCMVSIFYYTMTICLIIPVIQETGDFVAGGALASILIVYSIIVQTGLFSKDGVKQILNEPADVPDDSIKWYGILLKDVLLKVRFVETVDIHHRAGPNTTVLSLFAELETFTSNTLINDTAMLTSNDMSMKATTKEDLVYTLSLSVTNKQWTSCNETISFSSKHILGPTLKNKLGSTCLELFKWERYLNDEKGITLNIQLNN